MRKKFRTLGSVQQSFVGARLIRDHVMCLATGIAGEYDYVNVLQVEGISYDLKSEEEQRLINELYQALLRSLPYPVQIVWRVLPLQLSEYLSQFTLNPSRGANGVEEMTQAQARQIRLWDALAGSHVSFLEHLTEHRALLDRRVFLIVRVEGAPPDQRPLVQRLLVPAGKRRKAINEAEAFERACQELDLRSSELGRLLQTMGLSVHRLTGKQELVPFYHSCLTPGRASSHPLSKELIDGINRPVQARDVGKNKQGTNAVGADLSQHPEIVPNGYVDRSGMISGCCDTKRAHSQSPPTESQSELSDKKKKGKQRIQVDPEVGQRWTQLADLIAPASVIISADKLQIENEFTRVIVVRHLPRVVSAGWLKPLSELDEPMEVSFYLNPRNSVVLLQQFRRQQMAYTSSRILAQRSGQQPDPDMKIAEADIGELINRLVSGEERMLDISMQVVIRGGSEQELDVRTERIRSVLHSMLLNVRVAVFEQEQAFRSYLPHGQQLLRNAILLDSRSASTMFPFVSTSLFHPTGILEGMTPQGDPVVLDAWRPDMANANRLILGPPGWGKSYQVKSTIIRQVLKFACLQHRREDGEDGNQFQFIVVDPEREYRHLAELLGGQVIRLAPGSSNHINPFDLPPVPIKDGFTPRAVQGDRLADQVHRLHALLDLMLAERAHDGNGRLTAQEKGLLDRAIYETYRQAGITSDEQTQDRPAPLLRDLYDVLESEICGSDLTHLAQRLRRFTHGSLSGLFAGPTNIELSNALIVFDIHDLEAELRPIGLFLVSNFVWTISFLSRVPRQLVVDEAATLFQYESGARFLEDLVRRARKHYLGVTIISQHPAIFRNSSIPANCGTHVLMRQDATALDLIERMFKLSPREIQIVRHLGKGQALFITHDKRLQVRFAASELEHRLATSDPRELARRAQEIIESNQVAQTSLPSAGEWKIEQENPGSTLHSDNPGSTLHSDNPLWLSQWKGIDHPNQRQPQGIVAMQGLQRDGENAQDGNGGRI